MRAHDPWYDQPRWKKLRQRILRRDGYMCQLSKRTGKAVAADVVHHIFPREIFPEYQWDPWNLISLSSGRHNTLHDRDTDQLTDEGLALLRRTARIQQIPDIDAIVRKINPPRSEK